MAQGRSQFIGIAGQFHVAYCLSVREFHAAITLGNAPAVDIVVAEPSGKKSLTIQVKTSRGAHKPNVHGKEVLQWDVGESAVGKQSDTYWYAFVDLQEQKSGKELLWKPVVYLVPSTWVAGFVRADFSRKMYSLRSEVWSLCKERWDRIDKFFANEADTLSWCNNMPDDAKCW